MVIKTTVIKKYEVRPDRYWEAGQIWVGSPIKAAELYKQGVIKLTKSDKKALIDAGYLIEKKTKIIKEDGNNGNN